MAGFLRRFDGCVAKNLWSTAGAPVATTPRKRGVSRSRQVDRIASLSALVHPNIMALTN